MKKNRATPSSAGAAARWGTTLALLAVLALVVLYLAKPPAMAANGAIIAVPDFAAIDAYVEAERQAQGIPGLALGIVQGDQIVHLKGFGLADPSGRAVTSQTPFILFSSSKSFTALAIMQLVEADQVELDAPVQRYLPWFRVADPDASARITVRHLLNHTSDLPETADNGLLTSTDTSDSAMEQQVRGLSTISLDRPVGAIFEYVNTNYVTLGLIVQTVSGQPYETYVQEHIFVPLDMRHSFTAKAEAQQQGLATGYRYWFGRPVPTDLPDNRSNLPAGGLISSAEDMAHYLIAQLNEGRYGQASILSPEGIAEMHTPAVQRRGDMFYGMGWYVGPANGIPVIWHGGDGTNFHSTMVLAPEGQWGIVLLENAQNNMDFGDRMHQTAFGVISLLAGHQPPVATADNFLRIFFIGILGITALMVIGIIRSIIVLRRWHVQSVRRPQGWWGLVWHVVLPLLLHLALGLLFLVGLPQGFFKVPLSYILLLVPDFGYTLLVSGLAALGWGILRTVLAYFALRQSGATSAAGTLVAAS
jgi:CubicO group peptidase (beta-lactamase class C family)